MEGQMSIFDCFPEIFEKEPEVGEFVERAGPTICHIMLPAYIGKKVLMDKSTTGHSWFQCGILEKYFYSDLNKCWRAVVYDGRKQRNLIDHFRDYPHGGFLYETRPWNWEERKQRRVTNA